MTGLLTLGCLPALAQDSMTQAEAEIRLKQLAVEIADLKTELANTRKTFGKEQKLLRSADIEIQANALERRKLESTRTEHEQALANLQAERQDYLHSLDERRVNLVNNIMAAYRLGRESRLKLLLNQDSPAMLSRTLAYYDYFSRSQAVQIGELRNVLQTLDQMQSTINRELSALDEVQKRLQTVLDQLKNQRGERQLIVDDLSKLIGSGETRLAELQQDRKNLQTLLEKLSSVLADIPTDLGAHTSPGKMKGNLPVPVKGRVKHAFGQSRSAGLSWQGWMIGAETGSEVRAIAYGRVAFSDWLRGYGLLMIIDHGDGFMSLYGNNESLLHEVGDWVEPGAAISTVGTSPVSGTGLYFEIRKNSKALDPAVWLKR